MLSSKLYFTKGKGATVFSDTLDLQLTHPLSCVNCCHYLQKSSSTWYFSNVINMENVSFALIISVIINLARDNIVGRYWHLGKLVFTFMT